MQQFGDVIGIDMSALVQDDRERIGKDVAAFQDGWLGELGAAAPVAYGPQPNPTGPVPPGWDAPVDNPGSNPGATAAPGASCSASSSIH